MQTKEYPKVQIILESTRPGRIGKYSADWLYAQCEALDLNIEFELVNLADWELSLLDEPIPARAYQKMETWGIKSNLRLYLRIFSDYFGQRESSGTAIGVIASPQ